MHGEGTLRFTAGRKRLEIIYPGQKRSKNLEPVPSSIQMWMLKGSRRASRSNRSRTLYPMSMCRSSLPVGSPEELISHSSGTRVHTALCSDQHFTAERLTFQRQ